MQLMLEDGTPGEAVALTKNLLEILAERAYPPGRPLSLALSLQGTALDLRAKSIGSKREPDGRFRVRLRLVDLRREQRELIVQALAGEAS